MVAQNISDHDFADSVRPDSLPERTDFGSLAGCDLVDHHTADSGSTGPAMILDVRDSCSACKTESDYALGCENISL